jgi:signal transduction histidine kinase
VPSTVYGDPDRLRQVLINLIGNSMKFTDHGEIAVSVKQEPSNPGMLHFSVRDTGSGIAVEKQSLIFQAFAQADGSPRRPPGRYRPGPRHLFEAGGIDER